MFPISFGSCWNEISPIIFFLFFSSPEPTAQGELLVSKGDTPASVVRRHASTIVFFSETAERQNYIKFGL
jgi:hypothetical protein